MLDPIVRTYDPKLIVVTFGAIIFTGFPEGAFIKIVRNGDKFEKSKGADGSIDRINKNSFDFRVTATLKQTSLTNDLLSISSAADALSNLGVLPFTVKDLKGLTLFFAPQAWIAKDPEDEFGDSLTPRVWEFDTGVASKFTGGSIL